MLKLLRNVRKAYKQWRSLPIEDREHYSAEMRRITTLVRELGGAKAVEFVEGASESSGGLEHEPTGAAERESPGSRTESNARPERRSRCVITAELQEATSSLVTALSSPVSDFATSSVPHSVRIGGKLAERAIGRHTR